MSSSLVMLLRASGISTEVCSRYVHSHNLQKAHMVPGVVGWIKQLVVDKIVRKRYITTQLLQTLKSHPMFQHVTLVGLVSSHPAACNALAKYAGKSRSPPVDTWLTNLSRCQYIFNQ